MKRARMCLILSGLLLAGTVSPSLAQEAFRASASLEGEDAPRPPKRASNAVWAYWKAWDTITTQADRVAFADAMGNRPGPGQKLTKEQRDLLTKHRDYIEGVLAATAMDDCDWGSRYDQGIGAILPHLGYLRASARALGCDLRRCAEDHNPMGAADRAVAIFRLAKHAAQDGILISTLVGNAIGVLGATVTEDMIKQNELTPVAARLILKGLKENTDKDLYNTGAAIDVERRILIGWFRDRAKGADAGPKLAKMVHEVNGMQNSQNRAGEFIKAWSEQQVIDELVRADRYFDAVKAAWPKPYATVLLEELETQAWEGQWGLVAQSISGPFSVVRRSVDRTLLQYERVIEKLRGVIEEKEPEAAPARKS